MPQRIPSPGEIKAGTLFLSTFKDHEKRLNLTQQRQPIKKPAIYAALDAFTATILPELAKLGVDPLPDNLKVKITEAAQKAAAELFASQYILSAGGAARKRSRDKRDSVRGGL